MDCLSVVNVVCFQ